MNKFVLLAFAAATLIAAPAFAQLEGPSPYERDVISVVTLGRHSTFPTASCLVWANAEGLGVGPARLHGYHGVSMQLNLHPMAAESNQHPMTFADGLTELKGQFPDVPTWILGVIEKNRSKIESACDADHPEPFVVYKITRSDRP